MHSFWRTFSFICRFIDFIRFNRTFKFYRIFSWWKTLCQNIYNLKNGGGICTYIFFNWICKITVKLFHNPAKLWVILYKLFRRLGIETFKGWCYVLELLISSLIRLFFMPLKFHHRMMKINDIFNFQNSLFS